jgi:site-specific DNA recombinase
MSFCGLRCLAARAVSHSHTPATTLVRSGMTQKTMSTARPAAQPDEYKPDETAQQEITECDAKLKQHRAALEAGADPVLVTSWIKETQARRALAEARARKPTGRRRMSADEITALVTALGDLLQVLKDADPADKAEVYSRLGLTLTYHPEDRRMEVKMCPNRGVYVQKCPRPKGYQSGMLAKSL